MLKLRKITLENFGPFKDQNAIEFPDDNGVIVVYGENMRGKTTLLNAIRYVLFGTVLTRHAQSLSLTNIENWENALEGKHGFKVILNFAHDENEYVLTRECRLRRGVTSPQSDSDYEQLCFLEKNSGALGPDVAETELSRIMPESVSRFFLFDGELLQQYEELLRDESEMGQKIKDSIERILGVPILTKARINTKLILEQSEKTVAKAAQKNQQTQELGNHQARLIEERDAHNKELMRLKSELTGLKTKKLLAHEQVKNTERLMALFTERERIGKDIDEINIRQAEKETRRKELISSAWKGMLNIKVRSQQETLQAEIDHLRITSSNKTLSDFLLKEIEKGLSSGLCPTCDQSLSEVSRGTLLRLKETLTLESPEEDNQERINQLTNQLTVLKAFDSRSAAALLRELTDSIEDCQMERHLKNERIQEINEATASLDESEHRRIQKNYDETVQEISIVEKGIVQQQAELNKCEEDIQKLQSKMELLGGADLARENQRRETAKRLHSLLNEAVDVYRDELRIRVEASASTLFRKLTTEPDYAGLQINKNYGLTIVHSDGAVIPVRSAGAEHIVALSLMGALQKNAPLQGPIIMDSPFGRLDNTHTTKVVEALPQMAGQVMLLVYESEMGALGAKLASTHLQGNLKREYQIVRKTARHSTIEVRNA